ncbi:acyltransferase [Enterovirga sp.]|uniref:acyltransferase family protein n=1 Tax=Enterovirga sp. TaxID=2026350 RepID=UPI002B6A27AF|nr:acyltransferase [Enterovirga sp.]HMO30521.1 acyltransferase [Enterovirga sp.]
MTDDLPRQRPPGRAAILPGIQVLRAVAALMVVLHHAELSVLLGFGFASPPMLLGGSAGVDIFFVISGFIMLVSSRRLFAAPGGSATFLKRRLIRIVPLYWAVTSIYVAAFLFAPAALGRPVSGGTVLASYLFWPRLGLDGTFHPILVVGWTLNYEMFFYALFTMAVALPQRSAVLLVTGALAATVGLATALGASLPPLAFWGEPLVLEFAAGIALGIAYERGAFVPRPAAGLVVTIALALFAWRMGDPILEGWPRLAGYGLPALLLVGAVALARPAQGAGRLPASLVFLGDASYSLYLVHLPALTALRLLAGRLGLAPVSAAGAVAFMAASVAAAIVAAILSYLAFERPVTRLLRERIEKRPAGAPRAAPT